MTLSIGLMWYHCADLAISICTTNNGGQQVGKAENKENQAIINFLLDEGWLVIEINSGRRGNVWMNRWTPPPDLLTEPDTDTMTSAEYLRHLEGTNQRYTKGVPDILALRDGIVLAVEGKTKTGKVRDTQKTFLSCWEKMGGVAIVPQGYEDFFRQYHRFNLGGE
jgi:hypothetical protein